MPRKQILIVDDDDLVRIGLRSLLESDQRYEVVAEARDGREAVRLARKLEPHIIVMDVSMPDMNGVDATERICAALPGVRVLALSTHRDGRYARRMLDAGAAGYVPKQCVVEELSNAMQAIVAGRTYISPDITAAVLAAMGDEHGDAPSAGLEDLSVREREVLQLLAEGRSANLIAGELSLSVKTIETHRRRLMGKLGIGSIAELTRFAIKHGIIALE